MEMKNSVSLREEVPLWKKKHGNPKPPSRPLKNTGPEHEDEHQHGNPQFALKVLLILIAIILVIVILKATGVPFAVKDWLSHVTGDMIALR